MVISFVLSCCHVGRSHRDVASCGGSMRQHRGHVVSRGHPVLTCHGGKGWWERVVVVGVVSRGGRVLTRCGGKGW